jgi:hypothetical protein
MELSTRLKNKYSSSHRNKSIGVPQGCFILFFINDIADMLYSLSRLFADDSSLWFVSSPGGLQRHNDINHDLL